MAVILRLSRFGSKSRPAYRVVAAEKTRARNGRNIAVVGSYDPRCTPTKVVLNETAVKRFIDTGAQLSDTVRKLVTKSYPGYLEAKTKHRLDKIQTARRARKARAAKRAK